jgi:hypothetical protein
MKWVLVLPLPFSITLVHEHPFPSKHAAQKWHAETLPAIPFVPIEKSELAEIKGRIIEVPLSLGG